VERDLKISEDEKKLIKEKIKSKVPVGNEVVEYACKEIVDDIELYAGGLYYYEGCLDKMSVWYQEGYEDDGTEYEPEFGVVFNERTLFFEMDGHRSGT
jgi:hypothetical protein